MHSNMNLLSLSLLYNVFHHFNFIISDFVVCSTFVEYLAFYMLHSQFSMSCKVLSVSNIHSQFSCHILSYHCFKQISIIYLHGFSLVFFMLFSRFISIFTFCAISNAFSISSLWRNQHFSDPYLHFLS